MNKMNNNTFEVSVLNAISKNENKGAFVGIVTLTEPTMRKTNNPFFGRVQKVCRQVCQIDYDYESAVNRRLKGEGKEPIFNAKSLQWGEWVIPNKVISHKGESYIRVYTTDNKVDVLYLLDGRVASAEETREILSFCPQKKESARQSEVGLTEHQVQPRTYKVGSIISLSINGAKIENAEQRVVASLVQ